MNPLLRLLGLAPTQRDREIAQLVKNSFKSVRVVGRGTIKIDAKEVFDSPEFQLALQRAQAIVDAQRRRWARALVALLAGGGLYPELQDDLKDWRGFCAMLGMDADPSIDIDTASLAALPGYERHAQKTSEPASDWRPASVLIRAATKTYAVMPHHA